MELKNNAGNIYLKQGGRMDLIVRDAITVNIST
jgi:hypothetical protein